jgi:hypothetical protein
LSETGLKHDKGKLDWSLLDFELVEPLIEVLMLGESRYGYENWKKSFVNGNRRFRAARLRHEQAAQSDPTARNAEDGNCYHLAQVALNALFQLYHARKTK